MKTTRRFRAALSLITVGLLAGPVMAQDSDGYAENFEGYSDRYAISNAAGWEATEESFIVATNYSGNYVGGDYPIEGSHTNVLWVENNVTNKIGKGLENQTNWVDVAMKPTFSDSEPSLDDVADAVAAAYFNTNGNLVVLNCPSNVYQQLEWRTIPDVQIQETDWIRLTIAVNMADGNNIVNDDNTRFFQIYINGTVVSNEAAYISPNNTSGKGGSWFGSGADIFRNDPITNVIVKGTGYIDDLVVTNSLAPTAPTTWMIEATAGANGMIAPSGTVVVVEGNTRSFTITPDSGYVVDDVVVVENGATNNLGSVTTYTFTNVIDNGSIDATFVEEPSGTNPPAVWLADTGIDAGDLEENLRGDGMTPREAWLASVDPTNATFTFKVTEIRNENGTNTIEWVSVFVDTNLPPFGIWARTNLLDTTYELVGTKMREAGTTPSTPVTNVWWELAPEYPIFYRVVATNEPSGP